MTNTYKTNDHKHELFVFTANQNILARNDATAPWVLLAPLRALVCSWYLKVQTDIIYSMDHGNVTGSKSCL